MSMQIDTWKVTIQDITKS